MAYCKVTDLPLAEWLSGLRHLRDLSHLRFQVRISAQIGLPFKKGLILSVIDKEVGNPTEIKGLIELAQSSETIRY